MGTMSEKGFGDHVRERICRQAELLRSVFPVMVTLALLMAVSAYVTEPGTGSHVISIVNLVTTAGISVVILAILRLCNN